jgi:hypothetical protein
MITSAFYKELSCWKFQNKKMYCLARTKIGCREKLSNKCCLRFDVKMSDILKRYFYLNGRNYLDHMCMF